MKKVIAFIHLPFQCCAGIFHPLFMLLQLSETVYRASNQKNVVLIVRKFLTGLH